MGAGSIEWSELAAGEESTDNHGITLVMTGDSRIVVVSDKRLCEMILSQQHLFQDVVR